MCLRRNWTIVKIVPMQKPSDTSHSLCFVAAVLALVFLYCGCVTHGDRPFAGATELPAQPVPPDPLLMLDGRHIASPEQWRRERRPELQSLFQHYMYGAIPKPARVRVKSSIVHRDRKSVV